MGVALKPTDTIVSIFHQLKPREQDKVLNELCERPVCERTGHNYRPAGVKVNWFTPQQVVMCCTKCGRKMYV